MNEIQIHRRMKLNGSLLMERKKYCDFMASWVKVVDTQMQLFESSRAQLAGQRDGWAHLASCAASAQPLVEIGRAHV